MPDTGPVKDQATAAQEAIRRLRDADPQNRRVAAYELRNYSSKAELIVPVLVELLRDPDGDVVASALCALGTLGSHAKASIPDLNRLAQSDTHPFNVMAHCALENVLNVRTSWPNIPPGNFQDAVPLPANWLWPFVE